MAIYTKWDFNDISSLLKVYDLGKLKSFKGIAEGVENTNYIIDTTKGRFILTIFEKRMNPADIPFFMQAKQFLAQKGFGCPLPQENRFGDIYTNFQNKDCAIITFLQGQHLKNWNRFHCFQVGQILGEMHKFAEDFTLTRTNNLSLDGWKVLLQQCEKDASDPKIVRAVGELQKYLAKITDLWGKISDCPQGFCHADMFPDNVFFLEHDVLSGVIDFYFSCTDYWVYDLAITLSAWCFNNDGTIRLDCAQQMVSGYQSVRRLNSNEILHFKTFLMGAAMRFTLTRLYDWINVPPGAVVTPKDPNHYFRILQTAEQMNIADIFAKSP